MIATLLVLLAMTTIGATLVSLSVFQIKSSFDNLRSVQAYYIAEAGAEDALVRITRGMEWTNSYSFSFNESTSTVEISNVVGGVRTIISKGEKRERVKKVKVLHTLSSDNVSFHYGIQVGDDGLAMANNSQVNGNVFSNGSIIGEFGRGFITGSAKTATIGTRLENLNIAEDAYTHNCKNCDITGKLYFSGGANESCVVGEGVTVHPVQSQQPLPIDSATIDKWKDDAAETVIVGDYTVAGGDTAYLGPAKITGSMTLENNASLILTGTVWVEGNITLNNNASVVLDAFSFSSLSGVLLTDGKIVIRPEVVLEGSGLEGSYLLLLSTNNSSDRASPAIDVDNTASGGVFYTSNGLITLKNNVEAKEVTGYGVYLSPNAVINYEVGLSDAGFKSGPGGGWKVSQWEETE